jgi:nucleotide-binding universal stress UspA family protein
VSRLTGPLDHIACFIDESDAASRALAQAAALRALSGGKLSVVHVVAPPAFLISLGGAVGGSVPFDDRPEMEVALAWLANRAGEFEGAEPLLLEGHPASVACDWARGAGCSLMVAASHRGAVERVFLGSFAGYLAHHAPCSVLLVPPEAPVAP